MLTLLLLVGIPVALLGLALAPALLVQWILAVYYRPAASCEDTRLAVPQAPAPRFSAVR